MRKWKYTKHKLDIDIGGLLSSIWEALMYWVIYSNFPYNNMLALLFTIFHWFFLFFIHFSFFSQHFYCFSIFCLFLFFCFTLQFISRARQMELFGSAKHTMKYVTINSIQFICYHTMTFSIGHTIVIGNSHIAFVENIREKHCCWWWWWWFGAILIDIEEL